MTKYRVHGVEGEGFAITVEANNEEEAKKKALVVYINHFSTGSQEHMDVDMDEKCWEDTEVRHVFDEVEDMTDN